jgi:hypothetical protein
MHTGNRYWIAAALALLGCGDNKPSTATRTRGAVPLAPATPAQRAISAGAIPLAIDETGVPRLLRAADATSLPSPELHVARLARAWGVDRLPQLVNVGNVSVLGGTVARLKQVVDGLPIDGGELRVMTRADGTLVAASGVLHSASSPRVKPTWALGETGAITRALAAKYKARFAENKLVASYRTKTDTVFAGRSGDLDVSLARARKVWFPSTREPNATLVAAWVVEAYASASPTTSSGSDAFRMVIAESDGRVLDERDLTADAAFSYRVFAESTGEMHPFDGPIVDGTPHATGHPNGLYPAYVAPALVSVNGLNHPGGSATADPWLPNGRTETWGNNVDTYADFNAPDGMTFGDFRATTTSASTFDRTYDFNLGPLASQPQQMAGITSLFFIINWMHDFWYDGGFTESAGNAQNTNYGRGGEDRDAINAEAQDNALGGSRNNANMSTPDDGLPPRMQVFLWGGKETRSLAAGTRTPATGSAAFGPTNFDITSEIVLADDGVDTGSDACTALPASVAGKIVLVDRGTCSFKTKTLNVQNANGRGVIVGNNAASTTPPGLGDDATITTPITIPTLSVLQSDATLLKGDIAAGPVTTTMKRQVGVDLEGTLDASVIAHEFGHYVHHRLSLCSTAACGAMSEGWGDFSALLVVARDGDNLTGAYPMAIYSTQSFTGDPAYFGIRRAPYSADHSINDLSFRHMTDGVETPTNHPFNVGGANSEVHNAGEVWASMMWEGYVALQQAGTSFDDVRLKMRQYVVAGLLLAPPDATPTETRDAILTAVRAASPADHDILAAAYARRCFGSCAVSAPRTSSSFQGIVESNVVKGNAALGAPAMALATTCDDDSVLDAGETAHVTLPVANTGPTALTNVVATLASPTTGITITSQPIALGTLDAYGTKMATFDIAVADTITDPTAADFTITLTADDGCNEMVQQTIAMPVNTDDLVTSSATDTFDAISTVWTMPSTESQWTHARATALDGSLFGADSGARTDSSVTSPTLTADATTPVTITFSHKFSFEFSGNTYWDGGVIEISKDGGTTWEDISAYVATAPYNSTLTTTSDNPLGGRAAFGKTNASYPAADTVTLDLGDKLAGQMFQLRFRVVTDGGTGGLGWEIDDVAFTGITGTPFPTLVTDNGSCDTNEGSGSDTTMPDAGTPTPPDAGGNQETGDDDMGGCCQSQRSPAGSGLLAASVLALIARRRRRR